MSNAANSNTLVVARAILIWLAIIVAEIAHGIIRGLLLVPLVGDWRSRQIGVFTGSGSSWPSP